MDARLERWLEAEGYRNDNGAVRVVFAGGRSHAVDLSETDEEVLLSAVVTRAAVAKSIEKLPSLIWQANRGMGLVGFGLDSKRRLVGRAWIPKVGLSREEFLLAVRDVAAECDRLEFLLTGRDEE